MRLKPAKIEVLSKKVADSVRAMAKAKFLQSPEAVAGIVRRLITEDLRREVEIEKEAEAILKEHQIAIDRRNMSYSTLLQRTKQELAKKRKVIL